MDVNYLKSMQTSAAGLSAYRRWMNTVAENLANAQTTRTAEGGPYRRQEVTFEGVSGQPGRPAAPAAAQPARTHPAHMGAPPPRGAEPAEGAAVNARVTPDEETPFPRVHDPSHPDAGEDGYVEYPNVNPVTEMVNLILASRAYEANVAALAADKRMQEMALSIGKA